MLQIRVDNSDQKLSLTHREGPLQLGRVVRESSDWVTLTDDYVSREQLQLEELPGEKIAVTNISKRVPMVLSSGATVGPGETCEARLPVAVQVGHTIVHVDVDTSGMGELHTVKAPVHHAREHRPRLALANLGSAPDVDTLVSWFEAIVSVQRAAAGSDIFYRQTAQAVVDIVGLDYGMVLLRQHDEWIVAAAYAASENIHTKFSRTILQHVVTERRTFYQLPQMTATNSLHDVSAVVASPVFDAESDQVVGAVYGARVSRRSGIAVEIRALEAQVVQVLAAAVGAGLARVDSEADAARTHVMFEQFFTPELARALDRDPSLLEGKDRDITVLFADIRNFTRLSEKLGARMSCQLVEAVMERLTTRIREFGGVLVTYLGDGLLAMWNAPLDQADHALLACRAGLALIDELPALNAEWEPILGGPLKLGVGINTGSAVVGNMGSRLKLHYGPLGHTVNLASRVEGATKQLGVSILITGATRKMLSETFVARRVCRVRVVGLVEPVDLIELHSAEPHPEWQGHSQTYEMALAHYEAGRWTEACRLLMPLVAENTYSDVPSLTLMEKCLACLKAPPETFDPVWELRLK